MIKFIFIMGVWLNPAQIITMEQSQVPFSNKIQCNINLSSGRWQLGPKIIRYPGTCQEFIDKELKGE